MDIKQELGPNLSAKSRLLLPDDADFSIGQRWNSSYPLTYTAVIDAASEEDVSSAVKYANANHVPFIAFNGTHGGQLPLRKFKNGLGITTSTMRSMTLCKEDAGKTAWIHGSWLSGHVRNELEKLGKRTVMGSCDSTGLIGPMLGGGHGLLQGRYGLLADQIVEMRVVLADGRVLSVSESENEDLFWAMKGAGHNYGIVTSMRYKVYDIPKEDTWTSGMMVFRGADLEKIVPAFNQILRNQPVECSMWFPQFGMMPQYDEKEPVILVRTLVNDSQDVSNKIFAPLQSLDPLVSEVSTIPWSEGSKAMDWDFTSFSNQKGVSIYRFPSGAHSFDYPAMQKTYDYFKQGLAKQPAFAYSFFIWESYSTQAVKAVPDDATAVADRVDDMLVAAMIIFPPGMHDQYGAEAEAFGKELRRLSLGGQELHAYVNYAHGDESLEEVYGHQRWRLEKLRKLKARYDPDNRFGFYSPITAASTKDEL